MAGVAESGRRAQDRGSPGQVRGGCHLEVLDGRAEAGEGDRDQIYGPGRGGWAAGEAGTMPFKAVSPDLFSLVGTCPGCSLMLGTLGR